MHNIIWMKINNVDIIGRTDKPVDYEIFAFACIAVKNPMTIVTTETGIVFRPYFQFVKEAVATFNPSRIDAYLSQDKLSPEIISKYTEFTSGLAMVRNQ